MKTILGIFAFIVAVTLTRMWFSESALFAKSPEAAMSAWIQQAVNQANQQTPVTVDAITTLDAFEAEDNRLVFHYTLSNIPYPNGRLPIDFSENIKNAICQQSSNQQFFEQALKIDPEAMQAFKVVHDYYNHSGERLASIAMSSYDCAMRKPFK